MLNTVICLSHQLDNVLMKEQTILQGFSMTLTIVDYVTI